MYYTSSEPIYNDKLSYLSARGSLKCFVWFPQRAKGSKCIRVYDKHKIIDCCHCFMKPSH